MLVLPSFCHPSVGSIKLQTTIKDLTFIDEPLNVRQDKEKKNIWNHRDWSLYMYVHWRLCESSEWWTQTPVLLAQVQSAAAPSLEKAAVKVAALRPLVGRGWTETLYSPSRLSIRQRTENMSLDATHRTLPHSNQGSDTRVQPWCMITSCSSDNTEAAFLIWPIPLTRVTDERHLWLWLTSH